MKPDAARSHTIIEMSGNCLGDLLLQMAQISSLSSDAAGPIRSVPRRHEPAGFFVMLDLERNLVHPLNPSPLPDAGSRHELRNSHAARTILTKS